MSLIARAPTPAIKCNLTATMLRGGILKKSHAIKLLEIPQAPATKETAHPSAGCGKSDCVICGFDPLAIRFMGDPQ